MDLMARRIQSTNSVVREIGKCIFNLEDFNKFNKFETYNNQIINKINKGVRGGSREIS